MTQPQELLAPQAAVVFLFHGVLSDRRATGVRNYTGKHLPLAEFESFLGDLLERGRPLSIDQVVDGARGAAPLPDHGFAITFDDGFANNLSVAAPALEARDVPATFYVTTGFVEDGSCSWIDLIEYAVDGADGSLELPFLETPLSTRDEKIAALDTIRRVAKSDPSLDPYELAAEVWRQLGVSELVPDPELDRKLTWDEVRTLAEHPLFTVGGHGATHRVLSHLDSAGLTREIDLSLDRLDEEIGAKTLHFSYPEGGPDAYSQQVIARIKSRGMSSGAAVADGVVRAGDDVWTLSRVLVS